MLQHIRAAAVAAIVCVAAALPARGGDAVTPNDAARFLAGMPPSAESPLTPLTKERGWQQHARFFDTVFGQLEQRQLAKIRAWSGANLSSSRPTMFYMFSGPDFLYADAFYAKATTYVLSGLEPVGAVPDLAKVPHAAIGAALHNVERSMGSILAFSFFITKYMKLDLRAGQVNGVLPILYVFLTRSGKTIREVSPVTLDDQGAVHPAAEAAGRYAVPGVRILFAGGDGVEKTLYYFNVNLANDDLKRTGFLTFCESLGPGDSLLKSASYLMHSGSFSTVRDFVLTHSAAVIQDDSGIPLSYFDPKKWQLSPFGRYAGPIAEFPGKYQPKYAELFRKSQPMDFGIGYRWRPNESNLLLAIKTP